MNLDAKISDLRIRPNLVAELNQWGFEYVGQMNHMSNVEILRIPGMGGVSYRRLCAALGREPYATKTALKLGAE